MVTGRRLCGAFIKPREAVQYQFFSIQVVTAFSASASDHWQISRAPLRMTIVEIKHLQHSGMTAMQSQFRGGFNSPDAVAPECIPFVFFGKP
ncbi:hypothetical protein [Shimia sp.]|uniref:hypothetical protein n=1 Tax=Shimia sp. TaxID=1954381 RepID=UPI0032997223